MFFRTKTTKGYQYLQIVENYREGSTTKQRVITTLGRLDMLRQTGHLEALLKSGARFSEKLMVIQEQKDRERKGEGFPTRRIGPPLIFERLWEETGCHAAITEHIRGTKIRVPLERAIFLTVLHRLFDPGSDRAAEKWKENYLIEGTESLTLHHIYQAMGWLGTPLSQAQQEGNTVFSPRCTKDLIEEWLFFRRRDLFTNLSLIFFDTTTLYFEGEGGETLGERGHNKDGHPELNQIVVGVVVDEEGRPICTEIWPGNTTDVKTLIPIVGRMKKRFGIKQICIVADRGMISKDVIKSLESEELKWFYILGVRMRKQKEVTEEVIPLSDGYRLVYPDSIGKKDPTPLKVKEVWVDDRRYIVCLNEKQAEKDAADREAIVEALRNKLRLGEKSLIGNKGYRKYLKTEGKHFEIDEEKIWDEERFDGKWVLRTNMELYADEVALKYKQLWIVEDLFRSIKSILRTRPIYHKCDETIRGHVFCSFLAMVLRKELQDRLDAKGFTCEWSDVVRDIDALEEMEISQDGKRFLLRSQVKGCCSKVFQAAGVALPPTVRRLSQDDAQGQREESVVPKKIETA